MEKKLSLFAPEYRKQFLSLFAVHLLTVSYGMTVGWTAPILPMLRDPLETPLDGGAITVEEASWIGSSFGIGGTMGTFLFALITHYFGKKIGLLSVAVPHLILWSLIWMGESVSFIYAARFLGGLSGGGLFLIIPLFVADIADRRIRGTLGSLTSLHMNIGILISYVLGNYLPYFLIPKIALILPISFLILVSMLPETPHCLLARGKFVEAEKSLMFYRNEPNRGSQSGDQAPGTKSIAFEYEFESLKAFMLAESSKERLRLADFGTREAVRGLFIGVFLMALNQFSGIFSILTYAGTILQETGTSLDRKYALIMLAVVNICGNLTALSVIDRAGRKVFLSASTIGVGFSLGMLGMYSYFSQPPAGQPVANSWVPIFCLSCTIFIGTLGVTSVPFFVIPEIMPAKLRHVGTTICVTMIAFFSFIMTKLFPILLNQIQVHGTVWISSAVCAIGVIVVIFVMPETKGRNLHVEPEKSSRTAEVY
ncbi:facilitated trehalose transporter Tret1-like [Uranotaenia lowii]|uniref:facilitated trehalose transporter Tret1-like n=1 Tax=Uranotaenia lowii TaxID=190385 RepID=UPI002479D446|nr:facilitated trehalose transporter Tret1-like [Uranotaenia lowii]